MKLDKFLINSENPCPAVVICPGGGYNHLSNHEGANVAAALNTYGISCFVLTYDFTFPQPLMDIKAAVREVRANAKKYNVDPHKIGVMGFSAGAHLAGMLSEQFDKFEEGEAKVSARPDFCCLCYPVVTLSKPYGHYGSRIMLGERLDLAEELSLENSVRADMPPVFIWHTFEDKSVPAENSLEMAKALWKADVDCELHIFRKGRHGSDLAENIEGTKNWLPLFIEFLKNRSFLN
ncbi:MAG: alpha/beta hydrolase [Eubacterium sp.]|nr:alpha/beta hydrolase [Eubacterium sp.]